MNFKNKVVLVTGAASGIGRTISLYFAKASATLVITDIDFSNLLETKEKCETVTANKITSIVADLVNDDEIKTLIEETRLICGKIDVVINCAGIYDARRILDFDVMNVFDRVVNTNLRTIVAMINFVTPTLVDSKGCIVNISSISAVKNSFLLPYNIEKAALSQFTKCVGLELAPKGVRINSILCGPVDTNMLVRSGMPKYVSDIFAKIAVQISPMKKPLMTEDVAELVLFLASDASACITGTNVTLDCGISLRGINELITTVQDLAIKHKNNVPN